ncbi:MAG: hypothetical protein ACOCQR_03500 [bacterium]
MKSISAVNFAYVTTADGKFLFDTSLTAEKEKNKLGVTLNEHEYKIIDCIIALYMV